MSNTDVKFTPAGITQQLWKISGNMSTTQIVTGFLTQLGQTVTGHNTAKLISLWTILCHIVYHCTEIFEFPRLFN
jgi:hypothetical protein